MHLASIETLIAILEEGSLIGAAGRQHVSQSTVTARLQTLERELGHELLHRSKAGVAPTPAGLRVRRNLETIVDLWNQAQRDLAQPDTVLDVCTIGCHRDLWSGCADRLIDLVVEREPTLAVSVRNGSAPELSEWQRSGLTDLSITYTPALPTGHRSWPVQADELVLVSTSADSPVQFDPGYVLVEAGEDFARRHTATYATAAIARVTFDAPSRALDHITRHGGSAYLPKRLVDPLLASGELHRLAGAAVFEREVHLVAPVEAAERWTWFDDAVALLAAD